MRTYELRVYTLADRRALETYRTVHYPRHLISAPKCGIGFHGLWTSEHNGFQLIALASYADGDNPAEVSARYMASPEFAADMAGFDVSSILAVTAMMMTPAPESPLL